MSTIVGIVLTAVAYLVGKQCALRWSKLPAIIWAVVLLLILLKLINWSYIDYRDHVQPYFNHLLGYVTVALAVPLATVQWRDIATKPIILIMLFASTSAVLLPVGLAYMFHLSESTMTAFAMRAVTTPVALNIAAVLHAPLSLVSLIVILSGVVGAAAAPLLLKQIDDERAIGLALGLAAHAIGTAQAWQHSAVAGRFAALGMSVNALLTALWLPLVWPWIDLYV